jgi:hypothetical protein
MATGYKWVKSFVDRFGKQRHYFRRKGCPSIALKGFPGSDEFDESYNNALIETEREAAQAMKENRKPPVKADAKLCNVYVMAVEDGPVKVGIAVNPRRRLMSIQPAIWKPIHLYALIKCRTPDAHIIEATALNRLRPRHLRGEWFDCTPEKAREEVLAAAKASAVWFREVKSVNPTKKLSNPPSKKKEKTSA